MLDKIAIFSDTHGNLTALETVLDDIKQRGIETIYCLGDLAGKGPRGAEVVDRVRDVSTAVILGNWDVFLSCEGDEDHPMRPVEAWHRAQLGAERMAYLQNLTPSIDLLISGRRLRLLHASPESPFVRIFDDDPPEKHLAMFANTPFTGTAVPEPDVVGYGDIHLTYMLAIRNYNKILFNVGSVGNALDEPTAAYAILEGKLDSDQPAPFNIQLIRLPYDIEGEIQVAAQMRLPQLELYANELRTAVYRGRVEA